MSKLLGGIIVLGGVGLVAYYYRDKILSLFQGWQQPPPPPPGKTPTPTPYQPPPNEQPKYTPTPTPIPTPTPTPIPTPTPTPIPTPIPTPPSTYVPYQGTLTIYTVTTAGGALPGRSFMLDSDAWRAAGIEWSQQTSNSGGFWSSTVAEGRYYIYFGGASGTENVATVNVSAGQTTAINIAFVSTTSTPTTEQAPTTPTAPYQGTLQIQTVNSSGAYVPYKWFMLDSDAWRAAGIEWSQQTSNSGGFWSSTVAEGRYYIYFGGASGTEVMATVYVSAGQTTAINIAYT